MTRFLSCRLRVEIGDQVPSDHPREASRLQHRSKFGTLPLTHPLAFPVWKVLTISTLFSVLSWGVNRIAMELFSLLITQPLSWRTSCSNQGIGAVVNVCTVHLFTTPPDFEISTHSQGIPQASREWMTKPGVP